MSQESQILQYMKEKGSIDSLDALHRFGCFRLAARVYDLRSKGYRVESTKWTTAKGAVVSRYYLNEG